jgi:dinuclear metal center YbgI/SA1388 family protein
MLLQELIEQIEAIAPPGLAEAWDNVGLIVGDRRAEVSRVLLCIDLTPAVLEEAVACRCECVLAYHPVIFEGVKRFVAGDIAFEAARRGIAVYCPHTALDCAVGGTNDVLADLLGLLDVGPLRRPTPGAAGFAKLVTFMPPESVEKVAAAIYAAGAGRIGKYGECSFRSEGTGTFKGDPTTNPTVGQPGKLEHAVEVRFETVLPLSALPEVIAALKSAHPYEEPAIDVFPQVEVKGSLGPGRLGNLPKTMTLGEVAHHLKRALGLSGLLVSGELPTSISRVAVCAGAGRSLVPDVIAAKADLFVTGELPHHDALRLSRANIAAICTLHSNSERPTLKVLARRLTGVHATVATADQDPFLIL